MHGTPPGSYPSFSPAGSVVYKRQPVVVLSNMPLSHTHGGGGMDEHSSAVRDGGATAGGGDGLVTYHFAPSPPMSTYLVAWVIGELAHVEAQCTLPLPAAAALGGISTAPPPPPAAAAVRTLPVRVWGTSDRAAQFGHALSVACSALQTMERLLQVRRAAAPGPGAHPHPHPHPRHCPHNAAADCISDICCC